MLKTAIRTIAILVAATVMPNMALAEEDLANGRDLYGRHCASCHGKYGEVSNEVIPNILGQYPGYMLSQLANFVSPDPKTARGGVAGDLKRSILLELTVQDFRDIVAYLDSLDYKVVGASEEEAKARGKLALQGWWLANYAGCGNCHGDDQMGLRLRDPQTGELDPSIYAPFTPKLMALKGEYIDRQLLNYQEGRRAGGMAAMKHIMAPLFRTPRLIQAIGEYAKGVSVVPLVEGEGKELTN
jgi:cytochrome c553